MKKRKMAFAACVTAAAFLVGCGGSSGASTYSAKNDMIVMETTAAATAAAYQSAYGTMEDGGFAGEYAAETQEEAQAQTLENPDGIDTRKLIKNVDLSVETKQFDQFLTMIQNKVSALGGYIEQSNVRGNSYHESGSRRTANLTARIPIAQIDAFVNGVSEECNVLNKSEYVEDVTLRYTDLESRKKALKVEQDRLLELLAKAESMDAIIAIEQRMSDIRYELENYESQLRLMDNQVSYSTVAIYVTEAEVFTPVVEDGFWTQVQKGFGRNLKRVASGVENFTIWFLSSLPVLVFWGVILAVAVVVVVKVMKKNEAYHREKDAQRKREREERKLTKSFGKKEDRFQKKEVQADSAQTEETLKKETAEKEEKEI